MTAAPATNARPPIDPGFAPLLDLLASPGVAPLSSMTPAEARAAFLAMRSAEGELVPVASVEDRAVDGPDGPVPVRIVIPPGPVHGVLAWFHGGGFVIGDLDTAEATQRRLATAAGCAVVSVDYRLAPEYPAPAAVEDCWAATLWTAQHAEELGGPGARVAVGGDSAGGALAAVVAQRAAATGEVDLALQLLVYPTTDATSERPSIEENGEGYFLTAETMRWFFEHYHSGDISPEDLRVSPILADLEALSTTAPAVVHVAGYDPLHDEGVDYAERLREAGVAVDLVDYQTMIHGFWAMATLTPVSDEAVAHAGAALRQAFSPG